MMCSDEEGALYNCWTSSDLTMEARDKFGKLVSLGRHNAKWVMAGILAQKSFSYRTAKCKLSFGKEEMKCGFIVSLAVRKLAGGCRIFSVDVGQLITTPVLYLQPWEPQNDVTEHPLSTLQATRGTKFSDRVR
jgi:hypothetical protein